MPDPNPHPIPTLPLITEAEQPMPPRLKESTSSRMPNLLTSIALSEGVGQKSEQLTTSTPISSGRVPVAW